MPGAHVSGRTRRAVEPLQELRELHLMLHPNVGNRYLHHAWTLRDPFHPLVAAQSRYTARDCFVERPGHHLNGVRNAVQILNRHSARAERHRRKVSYSLFVRHNAAVLK